MDSTQRFSNRVENYVKTRPGYPPVILDYLHEETGFDPDWIVADIGSGTGISTALLLDNGNTVYGVEPNRPMRESAEKLLHPYDRFISVDGMAENTGLPTAGVDIVIASQAFHWFDPTAAKKEFHRILRARPAPTPIPANPVSSPGGPTSTSGVRASVTSANSSPSPDNGYAALIWNERQTDTPFEQAYESFLLRYAIDYTTVNHKNISEEKIAAFFAPRPFRLRTAGNEQVFDAERLKGRILSSSYIPDEQNSIYAEMIRAIAELFERYQQNGIVRVNYRTKLFVGQLGA